MTPSVLTKLTYFETLQRALTLSKGTWNENYYRHLFYVLPFIMEDLKAFFIGLTLGVEFWSYLKYASRFFFSWQDR